MATYMEDAEKAIAEEKKRQEELAEQKKAEQNKLSDEKITAAQESVALQKQQTNRDYIDVVRNAEIQREMDLRNIRETRANMGLSRSGISSTEQTAAVLSAGNKSALALRQKQAAVDELNRSLMEYKTATEDERRANLLAIDEATSNNVAAYGAEMKKHAMDKASDDYQAAKKAEADIIKAQDEASEKWQKSLVELRTSDKISQDTYDFALQEGYTAAEAIQIEDKKRAVKETTAAYEAGEISEVSYGIAQRHTLSADQARNVDLIYNEATKIMDPSKKQEKPAFGTEEWWFMGKKVETPETRKNAYQYVTTMFVSGVISDEVYDEILSALGFTDDERDGYIAEQKQ